MTRIHRAIRKRAQTISATKTANRGEEYLESYKLYRPELKEARGLANPKKVRSLIQKIDSIENEIIRLENKIDTLTERRRIHAAKLEEELEISLDIAKEYLTSDEFKDFKI